MFDKLNEVEVHFQSLENRLASQQVASNPALYQQLSKEHSSLVPLVTAYQKYQKLKMDYQHNLELAADEASRDLRTLALEENKQIEEALAKLEQELKILLLPKDPNDEKNILLEIRAGAGGDEAGIFVGDLYRMYTKFAEKKGWAVETLSASPNDVGGFKEAIFLIRGEKVYSQMKHESGVHRVQRVPKTEQQGRIHTSAVTVAVLPEAEDIEVNIDPNELRIDVFRSSGPGGQSVNTTDSAVRVTHLPTNLVVVCRDEKSQHKNKSKALKILKTRLLDMKEREQQNKRAEERQSQVGSGDRSEKIRTYNFPQGRVTDHRIGVTLYQLDSFMNGDIEGLLSRLSSHFEAEALKKHSA